MQTCSFKGICRLVILGRFPGRGENENIPCASKTSLDMETHAACGRKLSLGLIPGGGGGETSWKRLCRHKLCLVPLQSVFAVLASKPLAPPSQFVVCLPSVAPGSLVLPDVGFSSLRLHSEGHFGDTIASWSHTLLLVWIVRTW